MTVFRRMKNQSIVINDEIVLTFIEVRGDKVRLEIEHPKEVTVHRREVYEALRSQARTGSETGPRG
jgi:carbon storage regulator